jgi:hypothetical protein
MIDQRVILRERRDLSAIIEVSVSLYTRDFWLLFRIAAVIVPLGLASAVLQASIEDDVAANVAIGVLGLAQGVTNLLAAAAIIFVLNETDAGRQVDFASAYDAAFERFWVLLGAILRAAFHVLLLLITLIGIPWAIQRSVRWLFVEQAVMLDAADWKGALSVSAGAVEGSWWRTLGIWILITVIAIVPPAVVGALFILAPPVVSGTASATANAALLPFAVTAATLLYVDLQVRKAGGAPGQQMQEGVTP